MRDKRHIRNIVESILVADKKARNSDRYLYVKVVEALNPSLATLPLCEAFADAEIPNMETVRRARQLIQASNEQLRPCDVIAEFRKQEEESYLKFVRS